MKPNVPAVIVKPKKPILLVRPDQVIPEGDYYVIELETDQGLAFTRILEVDNMEEVRMLSKSIILEGGKGDMNRNVQRFSENTAKAGKAILEAAIPYLNPDKVFPKNSGEVDPISLAGAELIGQLGTLAETVRYGVILSD